MRLDDTVWPRRTERLLLRRATAADALSAYAWRSLPEVSDWITRGADDPAAFVEHWADPASLDLTLLIEYDGAPVGDLMVRITDAWAQVEVREAARDCQAELGWTLHPDVWGRGLATEAVAATISICFAELGIRRIEAHCFADNTPSWRLMERLGMRREAITVRESLHRTRGWIDGMSYALLREEWTQEPPPR
ncbi:GNAT family protein [Alteromonas gracilis]